MDEYQKIWKAIEGLNDICKIQGDSISSLSRSVSVLNDMVKMLCEHIGIEIEKVPNSTFMENLKEM